MSGGRGRTYRHPYTGLPWSRAFDVYVPHGLRRTTRVPLVVALHGCHQTAEEFAAVTRFNQLADRHQFLVVYPEQTLMNNGQRCWNWHQARNHQRYGGEPGTLAGIVRRVMADRTRWRIDPSRVYAVGLSAGGTMAMALGATYPDLIAAVGMHSAPPFRSASSSQHVLSAMQGRRLAPPPPSGPGVRPLPPTIVIHGSSDGTVWPANAQKIADQWLAHHRAAAGTAHIVGPRTALRAATSPRTPTGRRACSVRRWSVARRRVLEVWLVDGLGHAWAGGAAGFAFSDRRAPRASTEMWRFLSGHSLSP